MRERESDDGGGLGAWAYAALALSAAAPMVAGCARQGAGAAALAGMPLAATTAPADASAGPLVPPPPGRCPDDAQWNGKVCLGHGYIACPGEMRLTDAGWCFDAETQDAGPEGRAPGAS